MPYLVFVTCSSLDILGKTQTVVFPISGQSLIKKNSHKSRTSNDNDMKLGPKLGKRSMDMSNKY